MEKLFYDGAEHNEQGEHTQVEQSTISTLS